MGRLIYAAAIAIVMMLAGGCAQSPKLQGPPDAVPAPAQTDAPAAVQPTPPSEPLTVTARIVGQPGEWDGKRMAVEPVALMFSFSRPVDVADTEAQVRSGFGQEAVEFTWTGDTLHVALPHAAPGKEYRVTLENLHDQTGRVFKIARTWRFEVREPFRYQYVDVSDGSAGLMRSISLPLYPAAASANGKWLTAVLLNGRQRYPYLIALETGEAALIGDETEYWLDFEGEWVHQVSNQGEVSWMRDSHHRAITPTGRTSEGSVRVRQVETPQTLCGASLSPTGRLLAMLSVSEGNAKSDVAVVDLHSETTVHLFRNHLSAVDAGDSLCDGSLAWTADETGVIVPDLAEHRPVSRILDLATGNKGEPLPRLRVYPGLPLSPGRTHVWAGEGVATIGGHLVYPLKEASARVLWSPEGGWAAVTGMTGQRPALLDLKTGHSKELPFGQVLAWVSETRVVFAPGR